MRVYLFDEFGPETSAMLQALYSRSAHSVVEHVQKVRERGSDQFMASYYVGYGHSSIGDCGTTTLYCEDVSLLACKALQDSQLYSGQETSTRYIDFSNQRVHDPLGTQKSAEYQRRWISFYEEIKDELALEMKRRFPDVKGNQKLWEKAISARTFDVLRGFLPAGVTSQLSWTTNLRQAHDQISRLEVHPLPEVRYLATECRSILTARYPSSFGHRIDAREREYATKAASVETFLKPSGVAVKEGQFFASSSIDNAALEAEALAMIKERPRRAELPKTLSRFGRFTCRFLLDYGSFRDLQRHRGGLCRMPLLTAEFGFKQWYFDQLPDGLRAKAEKFVAQQLAELFEMSSKKLSNEERQYYFPLGMNVECELIYDLPQMVYVAELRSGETVHPTLRWVAQQMASTLSQNHPRLALYADMSESSFCIKRGAQDIVDRSDYGSIEKERNLSMTSA